MHEMSLVRNVLDIVLDACKGHPVSEVHKVRLTIGELSDVVDAYVPGLFRYLARGTVAENAEIEITRVPVRLRCKGCGEIFELDLDALRAHDERAQTCPHCGAFKNYRMIGGSEFRVEDIEVEQTVDQKVGKARKSSDEATAAIAV